MALIGLNDAIPGGEKGMYAMAESLIHGIHIHFHEHTGYNVGSHVMVSFSPALRRLG